MSKNSDVKLQTRIYTDTLNKMITICMRDGDVFEATLIDFDQYTVLIKKKHARKYTLLQKASISYLENVIYTPKIAEE